MSTIDLMIEHFKLLAKEQRTISKLWECQGPNSEKEETQEEHDYEIAFKDGEACAYGTCANLLQQYKDPLDKRDQYVV